jgi:carbon monoxide dehydrogenase subunit G
VSENEFRGFVTLKLGPITAVYQGTARFEDLDPDARTLVIHAEGRDKHGQGTARARVTARLVPENGATKVEMSNQVDITGKAAQFGRGILQDVSKEILGEFASNLQRVVSDNRPRPTGPSEPLRAERSKTESKADEPAASISVFELARRVVIRRASESPGSTAIAGATVTVLVILLIWWLS